MNNIRNIDIFSFGGYRFETKSLKVVGWKFIKKNIDGGNNITVRAWSSGREAELVIKKYMTGKSWKKKFRKQFLLANK